MKKIQCSNCGGTLRKIMYGNYVCEYCGTKYEEDINNKIIKIESFKNPTKVYKTQITMHSEFAESNPKEASEYAIKQLARNLADALAENMEVETEYDPCLMMHRMTAKVRIVEPKFMF